MKSEESFASNVMWSSNATSVRHQRFQGAINLKVMPLHYCPEVLKGGWGLTIHPCRTILDSEISPCYTLQSMVRCLCMWNSGTWSLLLNSHKLSGQQSTSLVILDSLQGMLCRLMLHISGARW